MIPVSKLCWTARPAGTAAGQLASFLTGRLAVLRYTYSKCMFTLQYITSLAGVLDEPNSQLTPLSGVAVQARQST